MVSFDAREPGTPFEVWERAGVRAGAAPLDVGPITRLVVLAAHPDDETLSAGGLLHEIADGGHEVLVVVATSGEHSHPDSPTHPPAVLAELRNAEAIAAVAALAPTAHVAMLALPDGALTAHREQLAAALRIHIQAGDTVVAPWRHDGHPDHDTLGEVAAAVAGAADAQLLEAPIWAWHWGTPERTGWPAAVRFELSPEARAAKALAMSRHRSQIEPLSDAEGDEALLGEHVLAHFRGTDELFFPSGHRDVDFDAMYAASDDPWGFLDRWYEHRKRMIMIGSLPHERYARALEIGCSNGHLAEAIAPRCDELIATDAAPRAVELATARLAPFPQVRVDLAHMPEDWPDGTFDLIMLSETGFYFDADSLIELIGRARRSLRPAGVLVACHWRPHVAGLELSGDRVHELITRHLGATVVASHLEDDFVLEVFQTAPATSVAAATGLR